MAALIHQYDEWPLFTVMPHDTGWVEIMNVPPFSQNVFRYAPRFYDEVARLERRCETLGVHGWIAEVDHTNLPMTALVRTWGAQYVETVGGLTRWMKRLPSPPILPWRQSWRAIGAALKGRSHDYVL